QSSANALRANHAALEAQVEGARIALQNATVKSPMDGIISVRAVQPGQTVQQGATLFTIVDLDQLYLNGSAPVGAGAHRGRAIEIKLIKVDDRKERGTLLYGLARLHRADGYYPIHRRLHCGVLQGDASPLHLRFKRRVIGAQRIGARL
ncbi:hypothetical protein VW29_01745, partial [Devosia limi DSM 17137]